MPGARVGADIYFLRFMAGHRVGGIESGAKQFVGNLCGGAGEGREHYLRHRVVDEDIYLVAGCVCVGHRVEDSVFVILIRHYCGFVQLLGIADIKSNNIICSGLLIKLKFITWQQVPEVTICAGAIALFPAVVSTHTAPEIIVGTISPWPADHWVAAVLILR